MTSGHILFHVRALEALGAILVTMLPSRYWRRFDWMPLHRAHPVSGVVVILSGAALGIRGLFAYIERAAAVPGVSILSIAEEQVAGRLPETVAASGAPGALMIASVIAYVFFTPLGLFSTYLVATGGLRVVGWWTAEPHGDPVLTGVDWLMRWGHRSARDGSARRTRLEAEGADEPDRLYEGQWAGLTGVDLVVVATREKPDWNAGTFIITPDGWYTLGTPFDRQTPAGLRTVYPLTAQKDNAVLRKGVSYALPPLRRTPARRAPTSDEPGEAPRGS